MELANIIRDYLDQYPIITVASESQGRPWICTVYFAFDHNLSMYFISKLSRRHSQELVENSSVACAVCKPHKTPFQDPCRGLQIEGSCTILNLENEAALPFDLYMKRFPASKIFHSTLSDVLAPAERRMFRISPKRIVLFDEANFPSQPQQELLFGDEPPYPPLNPG